MIRCFRSFQVKRSLHMIITSNIVYERDLNHIKTKYGNGILDQLKMFGSIAAHIGGQAYRSAVRDYYEFKRIKTLDYPTDLQLKKIMQIRSDVFKLLPVLIVFNIPFGVPLLLIFMKVFPECTPTWVLIDNIYQNLQKILKQNKKNSFLYFEANKPQVLKQNTLFQLEKLNLEEKRQLMNLCFGSYKDGTVLLSRIIRINIPFLLFSSISEKLIIYNIQRMLNNDLVNKKNLEGKNTNQQIKWKIKQTINQLKNIQNKY